MRKRRGGLGLSTRRRGDGAHANRDEHYDEMVHTWLGIGMMTITGWQYVLLQQGDTNFVNG
jgi:hypothetical protein